MVSYPKTVTMQKKNNESSEQRNEVGTSMHNSATIADSTTPTP